MTDRTTAPPPRADVSRRRLLARAGLVGAAAVAGANLVDVADNQPAARAALRAVENPSDGRPFVVNDNDILQFALNTEYVESEFFLRAVSGNGLPAASTTGVSGHGRTPLAFVDPGAVTPPTTGRVTFTNPYVRQFFEEIAAQEYAHLNLLRTALGRRVPARPAVDLQNSFTTAMRAAGVVGPTDPFDPFASQDNFLLAAYFFNDIGVTAYTGAAPYLRSPANLANAAGILGVESYHNGTTRTLVYALGQDNPSLIQNANQISSARNRTAALSGSPPLNDEGITAANGVANIIPTDGNSLAFSRGFPALLSLFYLNTAATLSPAPGGFTPAGLNSRIR